MVNKVELGTLRTRRVTLAKLPRIDHLFPLEDEKGKRKREGKGKQALALDLAQTSESLS